MGMDSVLAFCKELHDGSLESWSLAMPREPHNMYVSWMLFYIVHGLSGVHRHEGFCFCFTPALPFSSCLPKFYIARVLRLLPKSMSSSLPLILFQKTG